MESLAHFNYFICGEVAKDGHPLFRQNVLLNKAKPDFLLHMPGDMNNNLVAIEVKTVKAHPRDIRKDLKKLTAFCRDLEAGYYHAIYLIYGEDHKNLDRIKRTARSTTDIDKSKISLFWHRSADVPAEKQVWDR
jgi:hypothetical protein